MITRVLSAAALSVVPSASFRAPAAPLAALPALAAPSLTAPAPLTAPALAAAAVAPAAAEAAPAAPAAQLRVLATPSDGPPRAPGAGFDGGADRKPATFDEVPPLDERYATPESRERTVAMLGSSKTVPAIADPIRAANSVAGELARRGYNVVSGAGNAGVMGAAYAGAADASAHGARGENLVIVVRPAWGDENLADARAIGIADSESERVEKFHRTADAVLVFPGSAATVMEAAALISKNVYRGDAPARRIVLVGRDFFAGLVAQYRRLHADGLLKLPPEEYFTVVDTEEEILRAFPPR